MGDIQRMIMIENAIWYGSLVAPLLVGMVTLYVIQRRDVDSMRAALVGVVLAVSLGAAGSYGAGTTIIGALMGSGDIPYYRIAQAWHRMWYPLGIALLIAISLTLIAIVPRRSAA